jgi:DNA-binding transcriptional LysR family regulator
LPQRAPRGHDQANVRPAARPNKRWAYAFGESETASRQPAALDPPAALRAGELDLAVVYRFEPGEPGERVASTHLGHDGYALAVPSRSALARKGRLEVSDLAGEKWCTPPLASHATALLQEYCREHGGFAPRIEYPTDDVAMAQPLVAAGLAVAMLPSLELARRHPGVAVRALPHTPPGRDVWCVQPANLRLPATRAMIDALMKGFGARGYNQAR